MSRLHCFNVWRLLQTNNESCVEFKTHGQKRGVVLKNLRAFRLKSNFIFGQLQESVDGIDTACLLQLIDSETSIGFAMSSLRLVTKPPSKISLFGLNLLEVSSRLADSKGKTLMVGFAENYQGQ